MAFSILELSLLQLCTLLLALLIIYGTALAVYRLYFHPLARFPGPKLAATTKWYETYFELFVGYGGQYIWEVQRLHEIYGPIVRVNPDELHIRDPDWFETLYAPNPTKRFKYKPMADFFGIPSTTFATIDHDVHRKRRLANSAVLTSRAVTRAETYIAANVRKLCLKLESASESGGILELRECFLTLATDVVYEHLFGEPAGYLDGGNDVNAWSRTLKDAALVAPFGKQFAWMFKYNFSLPIWIQRCLLPEMTRMMLDLRERAARSVREAGISGKEDRHLTMFDAILNSSLPPQDKDAERMAQEGLTHVLAAAETTAKTLAKTTFFLSANPIALERVRAELEALGKAILKLEELQKLPYLTATLKEALRVSAPQASRSPLLAPYELTYRTWKIPANTPVSMSNRDLLLDETVFPDPKTFKPERWLGSHEAQDIDLNRYFVPFSRGTRKCPGENLAWAELYLVVAALVLRFDFEIYETTRERDIDTLRDCFTGEPHPASKGIRARVKKRDTGSGS